MIPGGHLLAPIPRADLDTLGIPENPNTVGLFAGYGGLEMGILHAIGGGALRAYSEIESASIRLLEHHHPDAVNLGGVTTIDWAALGFPVHVMTGGFPCQDVSTAGRGAGMSPGTRSGLWYEFARGIAATRPPLVVIENVPGLRSTKAGATAEEADTGEDSEALEAVSGLEPGSDGVGDTAWDAEPVLRALGAVLGDLASLGYAARVESVRASQVGAPHRRERVFIFAVPAADA